MWWMFRKIKEENGKYVYAYSRESKDLDGIMEYDSNSDDKPHIVKRCGADSLAFDDKVACEKFYHVIRAGYPEEQQICCG